MIQNDPMQQLEISNNTLLVDATTGGGLTASGTSGIRLDESTNAYTPLIQNNDITLRDGSRAILLQAQQGAVVENNTINLTNTLPNNPIGFPNRTGILTNGSTRQTITCNQITGGHPLNAFTIPVFQSTGVYGIRAGQSSNITYSCNQLDRVPNGIEANGPGSFGAVVRGNRFGEVGRAIWLTAGTQIGIQRHTGNRFAWSPAPIFFFLPPATRDAFGVGIRNDNFFFNPSQFIYDANVNAQFTPFARHSGTSGAWYDNTPNLGFPSYDCNSPLLACGVGNPVPLLVNPPVSSLSAPEQATVAGSLVSNTFPTTAEFEYQCLTYDKLQTHPQLATVGSAASTFAQTMQGQCVGEFYSVGTQTAVAQTLATPTQGSWQTAQSQLNQQLQQLALLDSLYQVDSTQRDSIVVWRANAVQQMQPLQNQLQQLWQGIQQDRTTDAAFIKTANSTIATSRRVERNLKKVNEIYLETYGQGIYQLTNRQVNQLDRIAQQCPWEGGTVVYRARAMVSPYRQTHYEAIQNCPESIPQSTIETREDTSDDTNQNSNGATNKFSPTINVQVYPNPTQSNITIDWKFTNYKTAKRAIIYNSLGQEVLKYTITDNYTDINLSELLDGVYSIQLFENEKIITTKRITLIKK